MTPFDTIVIVDWTGGGDTGARERKDAIWASVQRGDAAEPAVYLRNRSVAEAWLSQLFADEIAEGRRCLAGFDFPFAYPAGFAQAVTGTHDPLVLWDWIADAFDDLVDGEDRFDLAARLNRLFPGVGPFWFNGRQQGDIADLPRKGSDRTMDQVGLPERRMVEAQARGTFTCWQMGGAGSVGSQAMTGMASLARLRRWHPEAIAVWPFEALDRPVALVEVWPSLLADEVKAAMAGTGETIKDRAQVEGLAGAVSRAQMSGALQTLLAAVPEGVPRREEGWILGVGAELLLHAAARASDRSGPGPTHLANDCFALPRGVVWTPVDVALSRLRERLRPVTGTERVPVAAALGRVLSTDHRAMRANPPAANAAVDGYGFAHSSAGERSTELPLVAGRAAAGAPIGGAVPAGSAVRILTGALLPSGVDTVVLEEDCTVADRKVAFGGPVKPGANTRKAGEDVKEGAVALAAGRMLTPADLALMTALGMAEAEVFRPLRVGVLSTGDELVAPEQGTQQGAAWTYDANRPMLLALAARWGHVPVDLGLVGDDRTALRAALGRAAATSDVILTSGGASAGDEDHVSALLREAGTMEIWRIAMKPGRPLALGSWQGVPVFGLPGNPVAAFVCALIFARPALRRLAGAAWHVPTGYLVPAAFVKRKRAGRREFLRARIDDQGRAEVFPSEGSGRISGLNWADGLVELGDEAREIAPGDPVTYFPFGSFGF
ncbi:MAG: molybdopterin molybdenumtransferase MoeA [Rhodobacteraceae bacterium]|nr:molybdopterin molybdenumtransferase MoeA [Paracoccaceae bacterium]